MKLSKSFLKYLKTPQQVVYYKQFNDLFFVKLQNQKTKFWMSLHKTSTQYNYTFMESAIPVLPLFIRKKLHDFDLNISNKKIIQKYIEQLQNQRDRLIELGNKQFNRQIFEQKSVKQVSQRFVELKYFLQEQVQEYPNKKSNIKKLVDLFILAGGCNVLEYQIWNKLMFQFIKEIKQTNKQDKMFIYLVILQYMTKFLQPEDSLMRTQKNRQYKFCFLAPSLQDLFDFNFFLKVTYQEQLYKKNYNKFLDKKQQPALLINSQIIHKRINIFSLACGTLNISKQEVKLQTYNFKKWFVQNIQLFDLNQAIRNYSTALRVFLFDQAQRKKIQDKIWNMVFRRQKKTRYLQEQKSQYDIQQNNNRLYLIAKLMNFWKLSGKYHRNHYLGYIKPLIQSYLQTESQSLKMSLNLKIQHIYYSLVSCGLQADSLAAKIQHYVEVQKLHKSRQYLNALRYKKLIQNGTGFIKQELKKQLSREKKELFKYQPFNPTQAFWYSIVSEVGFDQLKKYKNPAQILPQHYINRQFNIFGYEIDIMLKYRGYYFACQISGSHMLKLADQSQIPIGRKKIRFMVLEACGINVIRITTADIQPKLHMRFNKRSEAKMYVIKLLHQKIQIIQKNRLSPSV